MIEQHTEIKRLFDSFPTGYINAEWEFVVGNYEEVSIPLEHIQDKWDSARFLLMFVSAEAVEGRISWNWFTNVNYRRRLRQQINHFLNTSFTRSDFVLIAETIGLCRNIPLARKFVENGCKLAILRNEV
ncbi:hypothetical protein K6V39_11440 [Streptococcus suis]|uniref:hypothetical protein n=1 Tax=Streptococcus suis TaxID=1307 RepID=UPI001C942160|nr:hypothetical protein [Streptococcus suis]MBY4963172.1 hypothetical protein [Streptococcus suis]MBY4969492.1 hypothetical protein [Streptococcus suis]MBY4980582.1 hypothetical protein [Streptococcus suis]MBY4989166.1 hypothetical protein [Streptococcus suis]MBY4995747.1 hypothetical protein [Streptococcus suis]